MASYGALRIPNHIGIIPDGNRRWAMAHGVDIYTAYLIGSDKVEEVLEWALDNNIQTVTVYVLSYENFINRSEVEKRILYELLIRKLKKAREDPRIHDNKVKVTLIGRWRSLPPYVVDEAIKTMAATESYNSHFLNLAVVYGGYQSVVDLVNTAIMKVGKLIKDEELVKLLPTGFLPNPFIDLIIRTGGEKRLSNFFPLESIYAELYFLDKYWPDFSREDFQEALRYYASVERKFGR